MVRGGAQVRRQWVACEARAIRPMSILIVSNGDSLRDGEMITVNVTTAVVLWISVQAETLGS